MKIMFIGKNSTGKYILKAHQPSLKEIKTYYAKTKTDCMFEFDRGNFRKGFKFFMVTVENNVVNVQALPRDYPYQLHNLE